MVPWTLCSPEGMKDVYSPSRKDRKRAPFWSLFSMALIPSMGAKSSWLFTSQNHSLGGVKFQHMTFVDMQAFLFLLCLSFLTIMTFIIVPLSASYKHLWAMFRYTFFSFTKGKQNWKVDKISYIWKIRKYKLIACRLMVWGLGDLSTDNS
jgi:hypothetical protein